MKRQWISALGMAAVLLAGAAGAQGADPLVEKLMVRSGLDKQVEAFPGGVQMGMQEAHQRQHRLSDEDERDLEQAMLRAFDVAALKDAVRKQLGKELTAADIEAALAWLESPTGRKITQLEIDNSTAEAYAAMQAWAATLKKNPPDRARVAQLQRLDKAIGATDFGVSLALDSRLAMVVAVTATQPLAKQREAFDTVKTAFDQQRPQIRQSLEQQTLVSMLYTYRTLADADLDAYVTFAESPAGRKYGAAAMKGVDEAVVGACSKAGQVIVDSLRDRKRGSAT